MNKRFLVFKTLYSQTPDPHNIAVLAVNIRELRDHKRTVNKMISKEGQGSPQVSLQTMVFTRGQRTKWSARKAKVHHRWVYEQWFSQECACPFQCGQGGQKINTRGNCLLFSMSAVQQMWCSVKQACMLNSGRCHLDNGHTSRQVWEAIVHFIVIVHRTFFTNRD